MVMVESMEKQEEQSKLCQKNQFNIYIQTKQKKHIQDEERHIEQKFLQMAEEQQEVVLVMEEETVKLQLEQQSKSDANKSD